ncbi:cinnamyl alcohol acyltransferase 1 [Tripterygium wilfordii]|uniref:Cinnamyl alcohol acyltransferase 1 n=1 Tax=Tripterygium wilfordii TaxID=458696 RepID=A0A7J7D5N4_TRIWF|nr:coniferyl alcohol acyltransferase-like [Tripterygium wilfordii]KAF5741634.1 cinnamyl alcohol acyltransferase 1 [Tripterygium wilfordii]
MAAGGGGQAFAVLVTKKEMVAALSPLQEHWLPLSNLDLLLPPVNVSVFFCYKKPIGTNMMSYGAMVGVLKKALAHTLVSYYALAGEVVANSAGEPEILCNNNGVEFVEAFADVELQHLNLYNPDESIEGKLAPQKKHGVLAVQATELKCGALVVGCTFDHRIADAYSANMFLVSWTEMAQSKPLSTLPSFRRSSLNPRRPLNIDSSLDDIYVPVSAIPPPRDSTIAPDDHLASRIYYVKASDLNRLQSLTGSNCYKRTKLESMSALLWKIVAKSSTKTNPHNVVSRMGIVVDGRTRLSQDNVNKAKTMSNYFGNVLSIPYGGIKVDDLIEKPLDWVTDEVHDFLENGVTKEHFLGLIDWVEAKRPGPVLAKIYVGDKDDGPAFVVSSGQRFPVSEIDFGWAKPYFGSYHFPWGGRAGYVMPMPSPAVNGDWVVYMHLTVGQLELVEAEASHMFRPLTYDYLNNVDIAN